MHLRCSELAEIAVFLLLNCSISGYVVLRTLMVSVVTFALNLAAVLIRCAKLLFFGLRACTCIVLQKKLRNCHLKNDGSATSNLIKLHLQCHHRRACRVITGIIERGGVRTCEFVSVAVNRAGCLEIVLYACICECHGATADWHLCPCITVLDIAITIS